VEIQSKFGKNHQILPPPNFLMALNCLTLLVCSTRDRTDIARATEHVIEEGMRMETNRRCVKKFTENALF
jgi:hypothetical protein